MSKLIYLLPIVLLFNIGHITNAAPTQEEPTICPPAELLAPCTCSETLKSIDCVQIAGRFNIKSIFEVVTPHIDPSVVFNSLTISQTSLVELASNSIDTLKFLEISITSNTNLEYIYGDAFGDTKSITRKLSLNSNHLTNVGAEEEDIFQLIRSFPNLESLKIGGNYLTSIPARAFHSLPFLTELNMDGNDFAVIGEEVFDLPSLTTLSMYSSGVRLIPDYGFGPMPELLEIVLTFCSVSSIGKEAFARSPKLNRVGLKYNSLGPDSFHQDAFLGLERNVTGMDLTFNSGLRFLVEEDFKELMDKGRFVAVGGQSCNMNGCNTIYLTCDERADWICNNLDSYSGILSGFRCATYSDVWGYCESLNK